METTSDIRIDKRKYVIKDREAYSKIRSAHATGRKKVGEYKKRDTVNKTVKFPESILNKIKHLSNVQQTSINRIIVDIVETELFSGGKLDIVPVTRGAEPVIQTTITFKIAMCEKLMDYVESIDEPLSRVIISMMIKHL